VAAATPDVFAVLRETCAGNARRAVNYLEQNLYAARRALEADSVPVHARWITAALDLAVSVQVLTVLDEIEQQQKKGRP
jgi:hypothetical protein